MKKILSIMLALVLMLSMATVAFATDTGDGAGDGTVDVTPGEAGGEGENPGEEETPDLKKNENPTFTKTYKITNADTKNPEETFTFTFTADHVTDSNVDPATVKMPDIPNSTVKFDAGTATTSGLPKDVTVALNNVAWPGVGVYYYKVNETAGQTAGVTYDNHTAWLKVTVAYDEGTKTYYTAFVTLSLEDKDKDGITDVKTDGFTNEYSAGNLSIKKNVTGNMGNQDAYFAVKVTLTGETGKTYLGSYDVSASTNEDNPTSIKIDEETVFYLKHNETITISNLPYGVKYTVVENDYTTEANGKYDAPSYSLNGSSVESVSDKEIGAASASVVITNNKGTVVDTGVVLDSLPYILMLAVVGVGMVLFFSKKRRA